MRYIERYVLFNSMNLDEYFRYLVLTKRPDFLLETSVFFSSKCNIPIEFLFFSVTYITLSLFFKVVGKMYVGKQYLFLIFVFFLAISFPNLFSGIRFYFGLSLVLFGVYELFENKNFKKFLLFSGLGLLTHFSMSLVIMVSLITYTIKLPNLRGLFLLSLGFFFIPKSVLSEFINLLSFSEAYGNKAS
ncbi:EpsG family protein, partial [Myroides odoratimimus]|uniref:EpsG family protein n=1 Tax=Myroides odoratimimus TaxID=76832 RepID=UPI0033076A76